MSYQIIFSDYFSSDWYQFITSLVKTQKINTEEYKSFGTFSQETNWEKIFALGDTINRDLQIKNDVQIIDNQYIQPIKTLRRGNPPFELGSIQTKDMSIPRRVRFTHK